MWNCWKVSVQLLEEVFSVYCLQKWYNLGLLHSEVASAYTAIVKFVNSANEETVDSFAITKNESEDHLCDYIVVQTMDRAQK